MTFFVHLWWPTLCTYGGLKKRFCLPTYGGRLDPIRGLCYHQMLRRAPDPGQDQYKHKMKMHLQRKHGDRIKTKWKTLVGQQPTLKRKMVFQHYAFPSVFRTFEWPHPSWSPSKHIPTYISSVVCLRCRAE